MTTPSMNTRRVQVCVCERVGGVWSEVGYGRRMAIHQRYIYTYIIKKMQLLAAAGLFSVDAAGPAW